MGFPLRCQNASTSWFRLVDPFITLENNRHACDWIKIVNVRSLNQSDQSNVGYTKFFETRALKELEMTMGVYQSIGMGKYGRMKISENVPVDVPKHTLHHLLSMSTGG